MVYDGPEFTSIYWPNPDDTIWGNGRTSYYSSRVASFNDIGTFVSSDSLEFRCLDSSLGVKRRLTMDYDGNLRLYSLNNSSGLWVVTWQAIAKQCNVHGLCGRNGICIYTPDPKCACPPYYEPVNSSDWSRGCKPNFERGCNDSQFLKLPHVDYYGFDLNYTRNVTFNDCQQLCLGDCHCRAFKHVIRGDSWSCYTKGDLFNGYNMADDSLYLRIPTRVKVLEVNRIILNVSRLACGDSKVVLLPNSYNDASTRSFKWVYVYSFGGAIGTIEVIILVASWCFFFRKHVISASLEEGYHILTTQFRNFSYDELKRATGKFNQVLGKGGFGAVYKGVLADARVVAVKKLENIVQGEEEFWAEVSLFGRINHMNLARIWGFCSEGKHRLLVYEYVANGSLDNHLFSSSNNSVVLEWEKRFKIALGTAKGLAYLHHECLEWVIHCDVKPGNILLDSDFEPKISDFGLVKLCQRGGHGLSNLSQIRGTKGYMAPEWTTNLPLTAKIDVYSYGVVLLELVKGTRLTSCAVDDSLGEEEVTEFSTFVSLAKTKLQDGEDSWMEDMIDPRLEGKFSKNQAAKLIEIGLSCVDDDRNKRPTMEAVTQVLADCRDETATVDTPSYV
uniref:non-specific serine/threonine protein kinase n=1 Tax=Chenopodium quinoa TaxID=63459 RepID=A0A803M1Q0_CHEQI